MKKIYKDLCIPLVCLFFGYHGVNLLISWMKVEDYYHYIFLLHPMSTNNLSDHYTTAHINYNLSNLNGPYSQNESYQFDIYKKNHSNEIYLPLYNQPYSCFPFITSNDIGAGNSKYEKKLDRSTFHSSEIENMFIALNFETSNKPIKESYENFILNTKDNKNSAIVTFKHNLGARDTGVEKILSQMLDSCKMNVSSHFGMEIYDFDRSKMITKSYFTLLGKNVREVKTGNIKPETSILKWFKKLFASYDITKEGHYFYIYSESIDSVSLSIRTDENSIFSPLEKTPSRFLSNGFDYDDITSRHFEKGSSRFIKHIGRINSDVNHGRYQYCGYQDYISFWVKYTSSEKIQWFRIFALTSLLSLLVTQFLIHVISFFEDLIKIIKNHHEEK